MVLFPKKIDSNQKGVLGGEASLRKLKESLKKPPPIKEEKIDTSAFQGKPYLKREEVRSWLRRDEAWKITKITAKNRPGLEKKLFDPKRFGSLIDQKEAKIVYKDFENFPARVKKRYGIKDKGGRGKVRNLLKKFLGK
jgi:hypothetical protein